MWYRRIKYCLSHFYCTWKKFLYCLLLRFSLRAEIPQALVWGKKFSVFQKLKCIFFIYTLSIQSIVFLPILIHYFFFLLVSFNPILYLPVNVLSFRSFCVCLKYLPVYPTFYYFLCLLFLVKIPWIKSPFVGKTNCAVLWKKSRASILALNKKAQSTNGFICVFRFLLTRILAKKTSTSNSVLQKQSKLIVFSLKLNISAKLLFFWIAFICAKTIGVLLKLGIVS